MITLSKLGVRSWNVCRFEDICDFMTNYGNLIIIKLAH